jgi:hypothetical protein
MSNPRATQTNDGIAPVVGTFYYDNSSVTYDATKAGGSASVGLAVTLSDDNTIATAADGEFVLGKLLRVEADGRCAVQIGGVVQLPGGNSATLTLGSGIVGALNASSAEGYIRSAASGTAAQLLIMRGHILSDNPTTAVEVQL